MSTLQKTALYEEHKNIGGNIINFFNWELPVYYSSIKEESMAVRGSAGIFDVSHMGEFFIEGPQAEDFINYIITNSTYNKEDFSIVYTIMCDNNGYAIDDLLVYKFNKEQFMLIVNASNMEKDFKWITDNKNDFKVDIINKSLEYSLIAIQGPKSIEFLNEFFPFKVDELKYYNFSETKFNDTTVVLSRTGYTGSTGFELMAKNEFIKDIWSILFQKSERYNVKPCGLGARDLLRIEAGFPLYGHELNENINPMEANLGWVIRFDKECDFIGKDKLVEFKNNKTRQRIGFIMDKSKIAREGSRILDEEENDIGFVTSGTFSFDLKKSIGMGIIEKKCIDIKKIKINISEKIFKAKIINLPFILLKR